MTDSPSETFCILPWVHLSTRPDGSMRVCCTANASAVAVNPESMDKIKSDAGIVLNEPPNEPIGVRTLSNKTGCSSFVFIIKDSFL